MKNNKYDIFYLGYFVFNYNNNIFDNTKINDNIIKYNPLGGHAYCLNKNSMIKILNIYNKYIDNEQVNEFYSLNIFNNYCLIPLIFEQQYCSTSDNDILSIFDFLRHKLRCFFGNYLNIHSNMSYIIYNKKYVFFICCFIYCFIFLKLINYI